MALPINVMAFPFNGNAPGLAAAPGHGEVALGAKKVARDPAPPVPGPAPVQVCATFFVPSATWPWPGAADGLSAGSAGACVSLLFFWFEQELGLCLVDLSSDQTCCFLLCNCHFPPSDLYFRLVSCILFL